MLNIGTVPTRFESFAGIGHVSQPRNDVVVTYDFIFVGTFLSQSASVRSLHFDHTFATLLSFIIC